MGLTLALTACGSQLSRVDYVSPLCGDGVVEPGEACDDGNSIAGDGCAPDCTLETSPLCVAGQSKACVEGSVVVIAAGSFLMGAPDAEAGRYPDEVQHWVTLTRAYQLALHETTQQEFASLMGRPPSGVAPCDDCPVTKVSWYDAAAYANTLSVQDGDMPCYSFEAVRCANGRSAGDDYMDCVTGGGIDLATVGLVNATSVYNCSGFRLPTEAEWEYAARALDPRATYGGDLDESHFVCEEPNPVLDPIAWFCGNASGEAQITGTRVPNGWGLYDMLGNVAEWCHDRYGTFDVTPDTAPEGPAVGATRVNRGGSYYGRARYARAATRSFAKPGDSFDFVGFRVARSR